MGTLTPYLGTDRMLVTNGQNRMQSRADEPALGPGESLRTSVLGRARPHQGGTRRERRGSE